MTTGMVEAVNSVRDEGKVELMRLDKMKEEELVALTAGQHWRLQKLQEKNKEWQKKQLCGEIRGGGKVDMHC